MSMPKLSNCPAIYPQQAGILPSTYGPPQMIHGISCASNQTRISRCLRSSKPAVLFTLSRQAPLRSFPLGLILPVEQQDRNSWNTSSHFPPRRYRPEEKGHMEGPLKGTESWIEETRPGIFLSRICFF